jgi:hypothetical protein
MIDILIRLWWIHHCTLFEAPKRSCNAWAPSARAATRRPNSERVLWQGRGVGRCEFGEGEPTTVDGSKAWYLVNPKIAGKWMFIPLKMYL